MASAPEHMRRDFRPDDLWPVLARARFDGVVVSALQDDPAETDWLLDLTALHPWILGVVGWTADERDLDRWQRHPRFAAVRHRFTDQSPPWLHRLARRGLACDLWITPDQAARVPGLPRQAIAATAGAAFRPGEFDVWERAVEALAGEPSRVFKIAGLINSAGPGAWNAAHYRPYIQRLLAAVGPARLMYGSDWPRCRFSGSWKEALAAFTQALGAQTMETRELLLGTTAVIHYRLSAEPAGGPAPAGDVAPRMV